MISKFNVQMFLILSFQILIRDVNCRLLMILSVFFLESVFRELGCDGTLKTDDIQSGHPVPYSPNVRVPGLDVLTDPDVISV